MNQYVCCRFGQPSVYTFNNNTSSFNSLLCELLFCIIFILVGLKFLVLHNGAHILIDSISLFDSEGQQAVCHTKPDKIYSIFTISQSIKLFTFLNLFTGSVASSHSSDSFTHVACDPWHAQYCCQSCNNYIIQCLIFMPSAPYLICRIKTVVLGWQWRSEIFFSFTGTGEHDFAHTPGPAWVQG